MSKLDERGQILQTIKQTVPRGFQSAGLFSACFFVNSSAFLINFFLSFVYSSAKSPRRGCSGSGSCMSATRAWITRRMFKKKKLYNRKKKICPSWSGKINVHDSKMVGLTTGRESCSRLKTLPYYQVTLSGCMC